MPDYEAMRDILWFATIRPGTNDPLFKSASYALDKIEPQDWTPGTSNGSGLPFKKHRYNDMDRCAECIRLETTHG